MDLGLLAGILVESADSLKINATPRFANKQQANLLHWPATKNGKPPPLARENTSNLQSAGVSGPFDRGAVLFALGGGGGPSAGGARGRRPAALELGQGGACGESAAGSRLRVALGNPLQLGSQKEANHSGVFSYIC